MSSSFPIYHVLVSITVLLFLTNFASGEDMTETIENICRHNEEYKFCRDVFYENITPTNSNISELTGLTINQAINSAMSTSDVIETLLLNKTIDGQTKIDLNVCAVSYYNVKLSFTEALEKFKGGDYDRMVHNEQTTARALASCSVIFATPPIRESPLNERVREMRILITMAVYTGNILNEKL